MSANKPWEEKWKVGQPLGEGGQGYTRVVTSVDGNQTGVIKTLKQQDDKEARARMYQEVAALKALHSIGAKVPAVIDSNLELFESSKPLYFVMEHIKGDTLQAYISSAGPQPLDETIALTLEICETIGKGIERTIYHRDLKPQNIIVRSSEPPDIVIIDYGLTFNAESDVDNELTAFSEAIDNSFLRLPERTGYGSDKRDPRSDITSLSAILFYCLTGKAPRNLSGPDGNPVHRSAEINLEQHVIEASKLHNLNSFFDKGLALIIDQRFQSIEEFKERLIAIRDNKIIAPKIDPITFAAESAQRILKYDRVSQLAKLNQASNKVKNYLANLYSGRNREIVPYKLQIRNDDNLSIGANYTEGLSSPLVYKIWNIRHGAYTRFRAYRISAKGNGYAVLKQNLTTHENNPDKYKNTDAWKTVLWFDNYAEADTKALDIIKNDFDNWLVESMQSIEQDILNK